MNDPDSLHELRRLLCALEDQIRDTLICEREKNSSAHLSSVAAETAADTIYAIDKVSEETILSWFESHWPHSHPVQLVMEGIDDSDAVTFPKQTPVASTLWKCIIDPIDGTRSIMYDKRPAWALAGIAPQKGPSTTLHDIVTCAMTELPTSKQWRADQISAVRGSGIIAEAVNVQTGTRSPLQLHPSQALDFRHGFASFAKFFPESKAITARLEEDLWAELYGIGKETFSPVFDDQYLTTGGQIYEILAGHDRFIGDIRPLAEKQFPELTILSCHPYDICTALLLTESGGIVEGVDGKPLSIPLDTTTPVAWLAYANPHLADSIRPIIHKLMRQYFQKAF